MYIGENITNAVVFIGFADSSTPSGLNCIGTGFLLAYEDVGYLITARHVAEKIDNGPFVVRANRAGEAGSNLIPGDNIQWYYHADPLVDLAAIESPIVRSLGFKALYIPQSMLADDTKRLGSWFDVGDLCYTVGLFHFVSGTQKNLPLVYGGNIALMPPKHEKIVVGNNSGGVDRVEAYLIESRAIKGASGSPVFVRPTFAIDKLPPGFMVKDALVAQKTLHLLGIFASAWFLPPDHILREGIMARQQDVVPVGLGVVVPAYKIIELLESEPVREKRNLIRKASAAQPAALLPERQSKNDDNPSHREDFNRLVDVAARKRPQGDQP